MGRPKGSKNKSKAEAGSQNIPGISTAAAIAAIPAAPSLAPALGVPPPIPGIQATTTPLPTPPPVAPPVVEAPAIPRVGGLSNSKADAQPAIAGKSYKGSGPQLSNTNKKNEEHSRAKTPNNAAVVAFAADTCAQCGRSFPATGKQISGGKKGKEWSGFAVRIIDGPRGNVCSEDCLEAAQRGQKPAKVEAPKIEVVSPGVGSIGSLLFHKMSKLSPRSLELLSVVEAPSFDGPDIPEKPSDDPAVLPYNFLPVIGQMDIKPAVVEHAYVKLLAEALEGRRQAIRGGIFTQTQLAAPVFGVKEPPLDTASREEKLAAKVGRQFGFYAAGSIVSYMRKRYSVTKQDVFKMKLAECGVPADVIEWAEKEATPITFSDTLEIR